MNDKKNMHIGVVQMHLSTDIVQNTQKILCFMKQASERGIDLLCFPECSLTGYIVDHYKIRMDDIKEAISAIRKASDKHNISAIVGTSWHHNNKNGNDKNKKIKKIIYNSAVVIRPHSKIKLYFKNDLTDYDKNYFSKGDSTIKFRIKNINCGVLICRDQNNPLLAAKYRNNIDILFYLSSHYYTKSEALRKERKNKAFPIVRAIENKIYVAKADAVGKQNGFVNFGGSIVVDPGGEVIAEGRKGKEQILEFYL
ncbi:MAG TPA: carbon-nitrogen hydrolase family protein [Nitrososphaeraceae archaeon]|nr:carbon-nitrogen hydrolase family protein [Nitrososphaeraceae archaeon]